MACCLLGGTRSRPGTTNNANGGSADGGNHNGNTGVANSGGVAGVGVNTGANGDNGNGGIGGQGGTAGMPRIASTVSSVVASTVLPSFTTPLASTVSSVGTTTVLPQGELENTAKYSKWRWKDHKMLQRHLLCFLNPLVQPASRALMALDCLNVGTCNRAAVCLLLTWD